MERIRFTELKGRVSWGSIFGGVITVLAISILLSILTTSIGLFVLDPTSSHPTSGVGTTMGIGTVISLIVSLAAGGFVAGKLAGADGLIHGFLVWGTTMIITVILGAFLAIGAVKLTANILGSVSSAVGNVVSGVGSAVGNGVSGLADQVENIFGDIDINTEVDGKEINQDIRQALKKSGVKEFQPDYINNQLKAVKNDLDKSVKKLITHPNEADVIINGFMDRLKTRSDKFTQNIDREDLVKALSNNLKISRAEAENMVDEYTELINNTVNQGKEQIQNLEQAIDQAKQNWEITKQKAREEANKAANAAGRSALISFFAMLVGAIICAYAGIFGTRKTKEGYEV